MQRITIAIIADDQTIRQEMHGHLRADEHGTEYGILEYSYGMAAGISGFRGVDIVCMATDHEQSLTLLERWSTEDSELPIIVYGIRGAEEIAERALRGGAYDVVPGHAVAGRLGREVRHALEKRRLSQTVERLRSELTARELGESDLVVPLRELEHRAIMHALQVTRGSVTRAAKLLGIGRATLYRRLASPELAGLRGRRADDHADEPMHASL